MTDIDTRYGVLSVPDVETDIIGSFLARYGEWAWDETRFVASVLPEKGGRVLDVGAFVGTFGIGVSQLRSLDLLCLVEANADGVPHLKLNVERNVSCEAVVIDALVGWPGLEIKQGQGVKGNLGATSFAVEPMHSEDLDKTVVTAPSKMVTLTELREQFGPFDVIKLDVEGMELGILQGDSAFLTTGGAALWVECNENIRSLTLAEQLFAWSDEVYYFAFPAYDPDNLRGDHTAIFPYAYEAGLLVAPKIPPTLDAQHIAHQCILRKVNTIDELRAVMWRTPRWGMAEWVGASPEELVALACHALQGESFEGYLRPNWQSGRGPYQELEHQLESSELQRQSAELKASRRLSELETERQRALSMQKALEQLQAETADVKSQLFIAKDRASFAEARLAESRAEAMARISQIGVQRERADALEARLRIAERTAEQATAGQTNVPSLTMEALISELNEKRKRVVEIETSTAWRATAPLRRFLSDNPRIHSILRRVIRS